MILIKNTQRSFPVKKAHVEKIMRGVLACLGYEDFDVGIWITTNKTIQQYNATYRGKNRPTDILSFSFHSHLQAGDRIEPQSDDDKNLGDLIISAEYAARDAQRYGISFDERLRELLIHGVCHLLGYDHMTDEDFLEMEKVEAHVALCLTKAGL